MLPYGISGVIFEHFVVPSIDSICDRFSTIAIRNSWRIRQWSTK